MNRYFFILLIFILLCSFWGCNKKTAAEDGAQTIPKEATKLIETQLGDSNLVVDPNSIKNKSALDLSNEKNDSLSKKNQEPKKNLTMAEQINIQKKKAEIKVTNKNVTHDKTADSQKEVAKNLAPAILKHEKRELRLPNGDVISQRRIGDNRFKRQDDQFCFKRKWKPNVPSDFRIGQMAYLRSPQYMHKIIIKNISGFFKAFANSKILDRYLAPDSALLVSNGIQEYIDSGALPDSVFRIGKIGPSNNGVVRVNVRFYFNSSCADGEVIMEENILEGIKKWLISDIQVDFTKLLQPYEGYKEPFLPSSYNYYDWE